MKEIIALFISMLLFQTSLCDAQELQAVDPRALEIYGQVMSPYCPGRLLNDCPSSAAEELRTEIQGQLKTGESKEDVVEGLYKRFGEKIRPVPGTAGIGLLGWLMPILLVIAGVLVMGVWMKVGKKKRA